jgi:hypothetical protein
VGSLESIFEQIPVEILLGWRENLMKRLMVVALLMFMSLAHAYSPEAGLWVIDEENNGLPGRGFVFDVQGRTLVVAFYGYGTSGSPTWYLSAGQVSNNVFSGSLDTYAGGMAFGANRHSAYSTGSSGTVAISFSSASRGAIILPGEGAKAISRVNFARPSDPNSYEGAYVLERFSVLYTNGVIYDSGSTVVASGTMFCKGTTCQQTLAVTINGQTATLSINGTVTDYGSYVRWVGANGVTSNPRIIKRGDELIMHVQTSSFSEVDYWRRVSADGTVRYIGNSLKDEKYPLSADSYPGALGGALLDAVLSDPNAFLAK